jgi:AraC-like DNA-binding protein
MKRAPIAAPGLDEMAALMTRFTKTDGIHPTSIARLSLARSSRTGDRIPALYPPSLCVIAQGCKAVMLGDERYVYDRSRFLVASVDLPAVGQVIEATPEKPYLCFMLELDQKEVASILLDADAEGSVPARAEQATARGLFLTQASPVFIESVLRLLRLLATPEDIRALAPLAEREILYRLLKSDEGWRLRQIAAGHGQARRIAKAIAWLRTHFHEGLRVEALAEEANMSVSSFHAHFKSVTAMSPLQYQKQLRLHEARRLMLTDTVDAATAGHRVGYESPSQFSREYRRAFGVPPATDMRKLLPAAPAAGALRVHRALRSNAL